MVEVFKTNISKKKKASVICKKLHESFPEYQVNFDLEDCDRILRVETSQTTIDSEALIHFLITLNCKATVLQDEILK